MQNLNGQICVRNHLNKTTNIKINRRTIIQSKDINTTTSELQIQMQQHMIMHQQQLMVHVFQRFDYYQILRLNVKRKHHQPT